VVFNFRMPTEAQKAMLFEKIHYSIERLLAKKDQEIDRNSTNKTITDFKDGFRYAEIISDIRKAFQSGLSRCKNHSGSGGSHGQTSVMNSIKK
jgi:hypothetical protein